MKFRNKRKIKSLVRLPCFLVEIISRRRNVYRDNWSEEKIICQTIFMHLKEKKSNYWNKTKEGFHENFALGRVLYENLSVLL